MVNCTKCSKLINRNRKGVNCSRCTNSFHVVCGGISDELFKEIEQGTSDWRCSSCRGTRKSLVIVDTPTLTIPNIGTASTSAANNNSTISSVVSNIASDLRNEMAKIENSFMNSLSTISIKLSELEKLSVTVGEHDKRIHQLENDNKMLKTSVKSLSLKSDTYEQQLYENKLQLIGVPSANDDSLCDIFESIVSKLGISININDITHITRLKPKIRKDLNVNSNVAAGASNGDIHSTNANKKLSTYDPIIVELCSKEIRNKIIKLYRNLDKFYIDNEKSSQILIYEYLCPRYRHLYYKAKLFAKENGYKFLWVKNGEIFLRRNEESKVITINRFTNFASIDGMATDMDQQG